MVVIKKRYNIKILIELLILFIYINKRMLLLNYNNKNYFLYEKNIYFNKFFSLKNMPLNINDSLIYEEKNNILKLFLKKNSHLNSIDSILFLKACRFGNCLILLNKLIFYCEIIGCKNIILLEKYFWFIKNTINIKKNNITIYVKSRRRILL
jgi:hypothetical protein